MELCRDSGSVELVEMSAGEYMGGPSTNARKRPWLGMQAVVGPTHTPIISMAEQVR